MPRTERQGRHRLDNFGPVPQAQSTPLMPISLNPVTRRVVQAVLFETLAVAFVAPVLVMLFGRSPWSTIALTLSMSLIALAWNYGFNALFERWEASQVVKGRSWRRRVVHGLLFEGGLTLILVPFMAVWLGVTLWEALLADVGVLLFFLVYTVVFTWSFDRMFGLPAVAEVSEVS
jgi:uncharacterized membrane protein